MKSEFRDNTCRYFKTCSLDCRGCKSARYDRRDYDGYTSDIESNQINRIRGES